MIIVIDASGAVRLRDPDDFRRFEVLVESGAPEAGEVARALAGLGEMEGAEHVWIGEAALIELAGREHDPEWRRGFAAMKSYAKQFGWVDEARSAIRAHIKRP